MEFKADRKANEDDQLQAKDEEKGKDKQRNIDDFNQQ